MGIQVGDNFDHKSKKPLDARTSYTTLALMKAVVDANINEGCLAYCAETDKYYKFLSTNTVDESTGKWREFSSGGGGGSSTLSGLTDVDLDNPTDGQVLKYDAESGKWVNEDGGSVSVSALGDIGDVNLTSLADGQMIKWDAATSKWVNADVPAVKERELTAAQYAALSQEEKMNGTTYYITDGEGGGSYSAQTATLTAGSTTVSFTYPSSGNYLADIYTSDGRNYIGISIVSTTITVTFEAPSADVTVYCTLKEV